MVREVFVEAMERRNTQLIVALMDRLWPKPIAIRVEPQLSVDVVRNVPDLSVLTTEELRTIQRIYKTVTHYTDGRPWTGKTSCVFHTINIRHSDNQAPAGPSCLLPGTIYGTDSGVYPHGDNAKQFAIMVRHGMSEMDATKAATSVSARYIGWDADVGALAPGRFGDLIAVGGDPLADISVLESVAVVIKGGLIFKQ